MDITFSVCFIRFCVGLNDIRAAREAEKKENLDYVVECVRWSVVDQYPSKAAGIFTGELRKSHPTHHGRIFTEISRMQPPGNPKPKSDRLRDGHRVNNNPLANSGLRSCRHGTRKSCHNS